MASELTKPFEEKMKKTLTALDSDYGTIRAGRANPHVLDKIMVEYYGTPTPLNQVGNITVPEPRLLQIQPWDASLLKAIEKAILASDIGITPTNDGKVLRLAFPQPTEDRRKELCKSIKKLGLAGIDYSMKVLRKNPEWVKQAHDLGLEVNVWTVDEEADMKYFIDLGVDYITTDYPERLQALLKK